MISLYSKPTDCHQYLHYKSSHPEHTKRSIIYSQTLTAKRVCSQESDFKEHSSKLKLWFLERIDPEKTINTGMNKVLGDSNRKINNKTEKGYLSYSHFILDLGFFKRYSTRIFICFTWMRRLKKLLHLNLWFDRKVTAKSAVI